MIGIGGSDLGARALQKIFQDKLNGPEVIFLGDTTDPSEIKRVCSGINWKHCAINPVSKSGNTVEPLSVFLYVRELLIKAVGKKNHAKHVFVTTQDSPSVLHGLVSKYDYNLIEHPKNIGGRWTVLSVVGLFSAAVAGISIRELRKGAGDYYQMAKKSSKNPSLVYAGLHYLGTRQSQNIAVLMPYGAHLEEFSAWYRQLFGESLGKEKNNQGKKVHAGITPIASLGPKDQHSQAQLYNAGPYDKLVTFITVQRDETKLSVPKHWAGDINHSFLDQYRFHKILNYEQEATALAMASHKRLSGVINLTDSSEYAIGQLFMFFELACVYLAELLDINAFDQPGVEEGKNNIYALLGKKGYEDQLKNLRKQKKVIKKYVI